MEQTEVKNKGGRPRKPEGEKKVKVMVALLPDHHAWLLVQPGGMSAWIERQVKKEKKKDG